MQIREIADAVAVAVSEEIAALRREAARERELRDAEHRAVLAELRAELGAVAAIRQQIVDRLATVKDGEPGRSLTLDEVRPLVAEAVAALPAPGKDADPDVIRLMIAEAVAALPAPLAGKDADPAVMRQMVADAVSALPPAVPGKDADPELIRIMVAEAVAALPPAKDGAPGKSVTVDDVRPVVAEAVAAIPVPKDGQSVDPETVRSMVAEQVTAAVAALPVPKDGAPGKLPLVRAWEDRVHYEAEVVFHEGASWQALRDTGRAPPHDDWQCIAAAGRPGEPGKSFRVRETWDVAAQYERLDVVALGGAAFVARKDDPGVCPGEGWQMIAMQGKRGNPGEPGKAIKGDPGKPGPGVRAMEIDDQGMLTLINGDGSTVRCDLYPLLSRF
jgi:hypothetical protein